MAVAVYVLVKVFQMSVIKVFLYFDKWFDVYTICRNDFLLQCKIKWHKCGLHPQMWIIVGDYHFKI